MNQSHPLQTGSKEEYLLLFDQNIFNFILFALFILFCYFVAQLLSNIVAFSL